MADVKISELAQKTYAEVAADGVVPVSSGADTYKVRVDELGGGGGSVNPADLISGGAGNATVLGADGKLFTPSVDLSGVVKLSPTVSQAISGTGKTFSATCKYNDYDAQINLYNQGAMIKVQHATNSDGSHITLGKSIINITRRAIVNNVLTVKEKILIGEFGADTGKGIEAGQGISFQKNKLQYVGDPESQYDAANKGYVDTAVTGRPVFVEAANEATANTDSQSNPDNVYWVAGV
jgi:hypothetical protein